MNILIKACFATTLLVLAADALASPTIELKDGDHDWMFFRDALPDGLLYIDKMCARGR